MKEIIICDKCNGIGVVSVRISLDDYENQKCTKCDGTGRLVKETIVKIIPFKKDQP